MHKRTTVYSWNTYPARLSVARSIPPVLYFRAYGMEYVADRNYHMQFRKGWSHEVAEITV